MLEYYEKDEYSVYMQPLSTGRASLGKPQLPTATDISTFNAGTLDTIAKVKVSGKNGGAQIKPTGLKTREWASKTFNDATPSADSYDIYVTQVKMPVTVTATGTKTIKGIDLQRYQAPDNLFAAGADNEAKGIGIIPGSAVGTYAYGFPITLSYPNFLGGDDSLFENINVYQKYGYSNGKKLDAPVKLTKDKVEENKGDYEIYLDIDPSSGKGLNGHLRLMASFYVMSCDPTNPSQPDCALFGNLAYALNTPVPAFASSVTNVLTPNLKADVMIPAYWLDIWSEIDDSTAESFVKKGELLQYADGGAIIVGFVGICAVLFGIFGLFCGKRK